MNYRTIALIVALWALVVLCAVVYSQYKSASTEAELLIQEKASLIAQNKAITTKARADVSDAFKMGIITCTNEDIEYLNEVAYEYNGTPFGEIISEWAKTWAYDDARLDEMVAEFMNGGTQ